MRWSILKQIEAEDRLAQLFNAYMKGLSTFEIVSLPRETMRECRASFAQEATGAKPTLSIVDQARRYYELTVLSNSLSGIHANVSRAIKLLEGFFEEYDGDVHSYAVKNRMVRIDQDGSDDPTDWYRHNEEDKNEEWKVVYKDDPEQLEDYSLHNDLAACFNGYDTRGEYIGTSAPEDFAAFTAAVATQTDLSFRKIVSHLGDGKKEIAITRVQEDGSYAPVPLADQIEDEINEDIVNERLTEQFNIVLAMCVEINRLYNHMPRGTSNYEALLRYLKMVQAVETE